MAHKPFARGVSHLMYIGDDAAPAAPAPQPTSFDPKATFFTFAPLGAAALVAWKTKGWLRLAALAGGGLWALKLKKAGAI